MRHVEWVDSATECSNPWYDRDETVKAFAEMTDDDMVVQTCGFVLYENEYIMVMTCSYHAGECGPYVIIPKSAIRTSKLLHTVVQAAAPGMS